ncbi:hypothetical protein EDD22DRAFT_845369 [Suillus occidentalis]|nr:hypothetical protein EDD22DRAFT_845369 [Suillus occidentalis]
MLEHGVPRWGDGERIIIVHFVKEKRWKTCYQGEEWRGERGHAQAARGENEHGSKFKPIHCMKHQGDIQPKNTNKEALMENPDSRTYDTYRETFRDFVLKAEATQHARKTKTQNSFIADYLAYQDLYLEIILESGQFICKGMCESCQDIEATFSCVTCTEDHGWCCPCIIKSHHSLPFHKIQLWIGKCFMDITLTNLGFVWYLGHGGKPCPQYKASLLYNGDIEALLHDTSPVTIVHSFGVLIHNVAWCHCQGSIPIQHLQLLRAGLFPVSSTQPKTAFTFEVLDHFLIDSLECKTSARSFFEKLTRLTNNRFPDTVLEICLNTCLKLHHVDQMLAKSFLQKAGQASGYVMWFIMKRLVVDGNFTAQHMNMQEPKQDIFLLDGSGYMVMDSEYQAHLASATKSKEASHLRSTCSNHQAVNAANANRSNLWATGVGATACARHGCFVPHSVVDFQKGEQYMNVDYSISNTITQAANSVDNSLIIYDVRCTAQIDGEILETLWAPFNKISPTACSMSQAHYQEILNDHMRNSNWKKLVGIDKDTGKVGLVSWLIEGINLEDAQDALRLDIWQLPRNTSATQKAVVAKKQQKLATQISKYHARTDAMTQGIEVNSDSVELAPEAIDLDFAPEEIGEEVPVEVMGYQRARDAMQRLGVDEETLTNVYQEIQPNQLTVNKEVIEENRHGQGSDRLAWFWRFNNGGNSCEDPWMDGFYTVNWLKAKARWQRWEEELSFVQHEMGWIVSWFQHKKDEWHRRYQQATKPGHQAYAWQQVLLWEKFELDAQNAFKDNMIIIT